MDMKKLSAELITAFTFAVGAGNAMAAEPAKPTPKAPAIQSAVADFNNHASKVVADRNNDRDVVHEPLLVKVDAGRYVVHESKPLLSVGTWQVKSYNKDELIREHGPIENIRTYDQYKADTDVMRQTLRAGRDLTGTAADMDTRVLSIPQDMKAAGETFQAQPPKRIPGLNN